MGTDFQQALCCLAALVYLPALAVGSIEFPAFTNYLYTTYNAVEHDVTFDDCGVMVLGSGVYRIQNGLPTVTVNYNPETVSTDYDEAGRLYFENINLETILDIYDTERSRGVILSMGGQTQNNIALPLYRQNVKIYRTSPEMIDTAENRFKFSRLLDEIGVDQPLWKELSSFDEAHMFCRSEDDLNSYLSQPTAVSREHRVVITKYIEGAKEIEMDVVAKNARSSCTTSRSTSRMLACTRATLPSSIHPPQDLDPETICRIEDATIKIGNQFIAKNNETRVIERNLRAARSLPFVSKVTGIDAMIEMVTKVMPSMPVEPYPHVPLHPDCIGVKVPQLSFSRLSGADPVLGAEMAGCVLRQGQVRGELGGRTMRELAERSWTANESK
ncbi:hypothetical protein L227DRAFT_567942 [Lentinus tigrinus ALCF2SS1-6]|uniref:Uncharacterized protein n=1 Tax=Lentinus tigrinus ALCF2SS1-6 TaxID=1328759 RepID=A0A5C2RTF5_9APHY|nr:hypothetical protein L227DRAFT_567942 [Lentinus tigrinus ALCF2SS1-6]